ncbi:YkgJ family cysteine cluster protein [Thermosulfuriphilus ammonigenes]|uniref:YkgJ family cysteine cluster protein n=1 Tax=Thermosulfuriphilus ammonigenes TaxID=1936021 RepID=A0A6G7PV88_9BACT|nr:YkgJ family cysteine cluster protein [Thermosulfuriphilus ammonigenes]MBA2848494.1 hypothetical protein [Thermosulfuriphilus ammonigenes]QIJ71358.1 YkgJ family cysteine cluster protein [Thermosulfuriphilus ammonigenes]
MGKFEHKLTARDKVIVPVQLTEKTRFRFVCDKGVPCFTECCSDLFICLTPYDIIRLKNNLGLSCDEFLLKYTEPFILPRSGLPVARLKMEGEQKLCPFLLDGGCSVYPDRPVSCRYYPIGMGMFRNTDKKKNEEFYYFVKEGFCQGMGRGKEWTIAEWRKNQGAVEYDEFNQDWMEIIMKKESLGPMKVHPQTLEMFFMVSTNVDRFRDFVFGSRFLEIYDVDEQTVEKIRQSELELLKFGFLWLKKALYNEGPLRLREEAKRPKKKVKPL